MVVKLPARPRYAELRSLAQDDLARFSKRWTDNLLYYRADIRRAAKLLSPRKAVFRAVGAALRELSSYGEEAWRLEATRTDEALSHEAISALSGALTGHANVLTGTTQKVCARQEWRAWLRGGGND